MKHVTEIELPKENGEQNNAKENKLLTTKFEVKIENRKIEGPITYSMDEQIVEFNLNSGNNQEVWGVNPDFKSYQQKWTIHGIFQHMDFYPPTENPNVMMRENQKTKSCEYIIIYHDELYMVSTTPQEILHMLEGKYKINIYLESNFPHDPGGRDICQIKECLEKIYTNVNMLFKDDLPRYLHIAFEIIKLLIKKGNLNLIHNKITYQHFNDLSRKRKLDKLYNAV